MVLRGEGFEVWGWCHLQQGQKFAEFPRTRGGIRQPRSLVARFAPAPCLQESEPFTYIVVAAWSFSSSPSTDLALNPNKKGTKDWVEQAEVENRRVEEQSSIKVRRFLGIDAETGFGRMAVLLRTSFERKTIGRWVKQGPAAAPLVSALDTRPEAKMNPRAAHSRIISSAGDESILCHNSVSITLI